MRTWPASTSAAALVRAFTRRACHSHLSRRWRSTQHLGVFLMRTGTHFARKRYLRVLAAAGQLFPERRELGERRIGIDRTITLARPRTRRILPMRRTAFPAASIAIASASVAATLVPALVASTVFAVAELAFIPVSAVPLAIDAIAWRPTLLAITGLPCRRAIRCGGGCNSAIRRRLIGTKFAEITVTVAPPMPMTF